MMYSDLFNGSGNHTGRFTLSTGVEVDGHLKVDSNLDGVVILQLDESYVQTTSLPAAQRATIHGRLDRGLDLTLIGYPPTLSEYLPVLPWCEIYCHWVLLGTSHFMPDKHEITETRFALSESRRVFPANAITRCPLNTEKRRKILKGIMGESFVCNDIAESFSSVIHCAAPVEIFSCSIGKRARLSVRKSKSGDIPCVDVEFIIKHPPNTSLFDAERAIQCVTRFFWLITGDRQYAENIRLYTNSAEDEGFSVGAYFPHLQKTSMSEDAEHKSGTAYGLLIDPIQSRGDIEKCLHNWAKLTETQKRACDLILSQFAAPNHPVYRIALASSAFEWFEKASPENSGRCPRRSLRCRIMSRIELIRKHLPKNMGDINSVVSEAIKERNAFVHEGKWHLSGRRALSRQFFSLTLEFIFLSSVLVECGWDMKSWNERGGWTLSHPFERYVINWGQLHGIRKHDTPRPKKNNDQHT